jgi:hypothetical protein
VTGRPDVWTLGRRFGFAGFGFECFADVARFAGFAGFGFERFADVGRRFGFAGFGRFERFGFLAGFGFAGAPPLGAGMSKRPNAPRRLSSSYRLRMYAFSPSYSPSRSAVAHESDAAPSFGWPSSPVNKNAATVAPRSFVPRIRRVARS